jgi:hypothetical protein
VEVAVAQLSEFNTVLHRVLTLTETTTEECERLKPGTIERWHCEGKLLALHQVIEYFLEIDRQKFGAAFRE